MRYYKLLSSEQLKYWDKETMRIQHISSEELMERAGTNLFYRLIKNNKKYLKKHPVYIFCGIGNNGGDGLVMARLLHLSGYNVKTIIVPFSEKFSPDFKSQLKKLEEAGGSIDFFHKKIRLEKKALVVDAIFGTGINRPAEGLAKKAIKFINKNNKYFKVISIDIPSGMYVDKVNKKQDPIIISDIVLSIELPKRSFYFPENIPYIKKVKLVKIGLDKSILKILKTSYYSYKIQLKKDLTRNDKAYKYTFGHVLIIGGSYGMLGASILSAKACLRAGAGVVTAYSPKCAYIPFQSSAPEIMIATDYKKKYISKIGTLPKKVTAVAIGPGLGLRPKTAKAVLDFIRAQKKSLIIDADALNILSLNRSYIKEIPLKSILTPHEGEFKRLLKGDTWENTMEKIKKAKKFAKKYKIILVLKGPYTIITDGKNVFFNPFANAALAKAGSGDVLTGVITGVYAQTQNSLKSALMGVQMHAMAAKNYNNKKWNKFSLTASDLIKNLKKI